MGFCAPMSSTPLPKSQLHSWCFAIVVGAAWGWFRRGWALGTETGSDRLWSVVSMQVTFTGTANGPARPRIEWRRSWILGSLQRVPSGPHTTCFLSNQPRGSIQVGSTFLAFSVGCYCEGTLGHWLSPRCRKGTAGASRGFRSQSSWEVRVSEPEVRRAFWRSAAQPPAPQGSHWPNSTGEPHYLRYV